MLTDGSIWVFPMPSGDASTDPPSKTKKEFIEPKGFSAHDGIGISLARLGGLQTGLITKRVSETVALRARDLRLDYVYQGVSEKVAALEDVLEKCGLRDDQVAYVGDDIIDLGVMRRCGLAMAVPNAREEVKAAAHYITKHRGGEGAARDAVEYILRAQGTLADIQEEYVKGRRTQVASVRKSVRKPG